MIPALWAIAGLAGLGYLALLPRQPKGLARGLKVVPAVCLAGVVGAASPPLGAAFLLYATGDAFLLDKQRLFIPGLLAFLVGHLVLAVGVPRLLGGAMSPVVAGAAVTVAAGMCAVLWPGLRGALRFAVPVYALTLVGLTASTATLGPVALAGAVLFLLSDAVLGFQKFRRPLPGGDLTVMITYYGAIFLLAAALSGALASTH